MTYDKNFTTKYNGGNFRSKLSVARATEFAKRHANGRTTKELRLVTDVPVERKRTTFEDLDRMYLSL